MLAKFNFIGRQGFNVTEEVKIRIAATYIMMTFGIRRYLVEVIDKIIIYPDIYTSSISGLDHKGEFNPGMKAVVFSWADFISGEDSATDNINLGIHEFSHVLHFHGKRSNDVSASIFADMFSNIHEAISHPPNRDRLVNSGYFRIYAYTNEFEFLAVILEHYFETPQQFEREFPELFAKVSKMLNHKHSRD